MSRRTTPRNFNRVRGLPIWATLLLPILAQVAPAAADGPAVALAEVRQEGSFVRVTGTASFAEPSFVTLATDQSDSPLAETASDLGANLTAIAMRGTLEGALEIRWTVSEFPDFPEERDPTGVIYGVRFAVDPPGPAPETYWRVEAERFDYTALSLEGEGTLWSCADVELCHQSVETVAAKGLPVTFDRAEKVAKMTLSAQAVEAPPGSNLLFRYPDVPGRPITLAAVGARYAEDAAWRLTTDEITSEHLPYKVPGRELALSVGPADLDPESVQYEPPISPNADGTFEGSVNVFGLHGPQTVYARACFGDGNCAYATADVVLG